jgi:carboxyl-terminal processing protease
VRPRLLPIALLVAVPALLVGIWWGGHPSKLPGFLRDAFVSDSAQSALIDEALDVISDDYYRPVKRAQLADIITDKGLTGAVKSLKDRFSFYFDPKTFRQFNESSEGRFSGVGMQVLPDARGLRVSDVFRRSPAARAGMKRGDLVVAVNGRSLAGKSSDVATSLIKGEAGTKVRLTVRTAQDERRLVLTRRNITVPLVTSRLVGTGAGRTAVVRVSSFSAEGAHAQVGTALRTGVRRGAKAVVLDLRGNPGGLLQEAVLTGSLFIPKGPIVITDGRSRSRHVYNAQGGAISSRIPVAVLVNHGSASAAEIVAGAIQDRKRGILVGTRSFGKGVFQEVRRLSNGGALDITVGQYFLPSGRNLGGGGVAEGKGLAPDVVARDEPKKPGDEVLRAALRALAERR